MVYHLFTRLLTHPWVQMMIVSHEIQDGDDVMLGFCADHWIGRGDEWIRITKGVFNACIDVGLLENGKFLGGEEAIEEGENGCHIGVLVDFLCATTDFNFFVVWSQRGLKPIGFSTACIRRASPVKG